MRTKSIYTSVRCWFRLAVDMQPKPQVDFIVADPVEVLVPGSGSSQKFGCRGLLLLGAPRKFHPNKYNISEIKTRSGFVNVLNRYDAGVRTPLQWRACSAPQTLYSLGNIHSPRTSPLSALRVLLVGPSALRLLPFEPRHFR